MSPNHRSRVANAIRFLFMLSSSISQAASSSRVKRGEFPSLSLANFCVLSLSLIPVPRLRFVPLFERVPRAVPFLLSLPLTKVVRMELINESGYMSKNTGRRVGRQAQMSATQVSGTDQ